MSVHQLPDGRWICKFPSGTIPNHPKKTKEYFGRGGEGERKAKDRNIELGIGVVAKVAATPIFSTLAGAYVESRSGSMAESTISSLKYKLVSIIIPAIGGLQAHELSHEVLDKYVDGRRSRGVKSRTIRDDITYIRAVMNFAIKRSLIISNPVQGYTLPKDDSELITPPSKAEFEAIISKAAPHIQRAMYLSYYTGTRPGPIELYSLTWLSVNFINRTIMITSADKGGIERREIPLAPKLYDYLDKWYEEDTKKGKSKYIIHFGGKKVESIKTGWNAAKKRARVTRRIRMYDLRHMCGSELLASGVDIKTISEILGNSPEQCSKTYLHVRTPQKKKAVEFL